MWRKQSRYPRTSYRRPGSSGRAPSPPRAGLSRRGVIGAAVVVGAAGLVDLLRGSSRHAAADTVSTPSTRRTPVRRSPTRTQQAAVDPSATGAHRAPAGHGHGDAPPGPHERAQYGPHGHRVVPDDARARHRIEEHVTLPHPTVRVRHRPIYNLSEIDPHPPHKAIALTVDDGPDPEWTPKVLHLLDKYQMQASFCVVGIHADSYPKLIRDIHRAGHVLVNHSYTHVQPFARQTEKRIVAEITRTQRAIERAAKVTPQLFRSPGGDWSHFVFRAVAAYGLTPLDWDVDPDDWARPGTKKIERAMLKGRPGDIVLCHDGGGNRSETVRALRKVLPTWKHRGYTTVPLVLPDHTTKHHGK